MALPAAPVLSAAELPPALQRARHELSAAKFERACELAAPEFEFARDQRAWQVAAEAALVLARARGNQRLSESALRWAHEALQAAHLAGRSDLACASWVAVAREHAQLEEGGPAQRAVDEVMALVGSLQTPDALEAVHNGLMTVYSELGLTAMAVSCARRSLEYAQATGEAARVSMARTNLLVMGGVACEQLLEPDPEGARRLLDELRPHLEALQDEVVPLASPLADARLLRVRGALMRCEGRWEPAHEAFAALARMADMLPPALACSAWIELGLVQRHLGLLDDARASGHAAEAINPVPVAPRRAVDLRRLSLIRDLTGRTQEALELIRRYQDRRHHILTTALESSSAALKARLDEQALRVENISLRQRNASLQASVEDVRHLASTDPLTGLLNRRGLEAVWQGRDDESTCVLALIDLDHFKRVNDECSHATGDAVLQRVAQMMSNALRDHDHQARYGGEEFAVVLMNIDLAQAHAAMDRLRAAVQDHDWHALAPGISITLSAGLVRVEIGESFEAAAARADRLLYAAKSQGRNRVVSA